MVNDAVPSALTVRPSPDQATAPHSTLGPVPEGTASDNVTTVPVGRSTPAGSAKPFSAVRASTTEPASRPGAAGQDAVTVNTASAISGDVRSKSPSTALATPNVPVSSVAVLVTVNV